tara:strand:+ start:138 stop:905 length:768 start_codon:yes stop_codon:yes gene_type:complete
MALVMGLILGLIGAGGSILTLPILVYLLSVPPKLATSYSLCIVGITALIGSLTYWKKGNVFFKEAIIFSMPAMFTTWITRSLILPSLPNSIGIFTTDTIIMLFFSGLMITSASIMLLSQTKSTPYTSKLMSPKQWSKLIFGSLCVGMITGFVGAGGGFLIFPSLIYFYGFSTKQAIGTSLTVITLNALLGFISDLSIGLVINWNLLILFMVMTILGVTVGALLSEKISEVKLKRFFAGFTLILGCIILTHELNLF